MRRTLLVIVGEEFERIAWSLSADSKERARPVAEVRLRWGRLLKQSFQG